MNDSIMRLGVEISEMNDDEIKIAVESALEHSSCKACNFIMKNNPEVKKTIELIKQKKDKARGNIILTLSVFCENYFKVDENKNFMCSFTQNFNWDSLGSAVIDEKCALCGGKILVSAFLMKVEGASVSVLCPACFNPKATARDIVKTI